MTRSLLTTIFFVLLAGSLSAQDSLFWARYDAVVDSVFQATDSSGVRLAVIAPLLAERRRKGPVNAELAYRYHWIAWKSYIFGDYRVRPYADTAILLRTQAQVGKPDIAQSIYQRGRVLKNMARHQSALRDFEVAVRMMREAYDEAATPKVRRDLANRLGYFYREAANSARENGDFGLADLWLDQIGPLLSVSPNAWTEFEAALTRADVHNDAGRYRRAVAGYRLLLDSPAYEKASTTNQTVLLQNLGTAYSKSGRPNDAREYLEQAAARYVAAKDTRRLSSVQSELISVLNDLEEFQAAEEMFAAALDHANTAHPNGKAAVLGELFAFGAETKALQNDFTTAGSLLRRGFEALIEDPVFVGPAGLPVLENALIYSREELLTVLTKKRSAHVRAYDAGVESDGLELALLTARTIDTLFRRSRSELSFTSSLGALFTLENREYEAAVNLALRLYREKNNDRYLTEAYHFATGRKGQLLRKYLMTSRTAESLGVDPELIDRKTRVEWRIAATEDSLSVAPEDRRQGLRDTLLRLRDLETGFSEQLRTAYPAYVRAVRGLPEVDPVATASNLESGRMVADYFLGTDSIYVFILDRQSGLSARVLHRPDGLEEAISGVLSDTSAAAELYDLLVAPVLNSRPDVDRLQLIPDGYLWQVPFATLWHNGRYLVEDVAVSYAYAAGLLFDDEANSSPTNNLDDYLGFGISYKDILRGISASDQRGPVVTELRGMGRLPWAGKEVSAAAAILNGPTYLENDATKSRFLAEAGRGGIVHLSMHGLLRPNPMESALVFYDETEGYALLTMGEVLAGRYPNDLTVLSACHTGGGPIRTTEGMQSIGRAFTAAGSRATITSTWAARDDSTHDILVAFYGHFRDGLPKDVALQRAVKTFLASGTVTDRLPVNWGNLVVTGEVAGMDKGWGIWSYLLPGALLIGGLAFLVVRAD